MRGPEGKRQTDSGTTPLEQSRAVCSLLDEPLQVIKKKTVRKVGGSVGASVNVDIWSAKCIKDSFIAATIHYVGDGSLKNAFLGLKRLKGRHDAQTIKWGYLKILNSMGINECSIYRMVTDSGANIVCAFKNKYGVLLHGETGNAGYEEVTAVSISSDEDDRFYLLRR
ncbi:unnamed protein product [Toxocara canis]|uniref:WGR domain-containing protein n=1 Tax=Toxocara canis TaxID=6265 RepID=A0A183UIQ6_TOXCA|nr:unnamed protein product [Toxocara canis]